MLRNGFSYWLQQINWPISSSPKLFVSACLLGKAVRYDGKSKPIDWVVTVSPLVEWVEICPEVEAGLGIPRPPVQLVQGGSGISALGRDIPIDVTKELNHTGRELGQRLVSLQVAGCLLKSKSPSCGVGTTPVFDSDGQIVETQGNGLIADKFRQQHSVVEDDQGVTNEYQRLVFLMRAKLYQQYLAGKLSEHSQMKREIESLPNALAYPLLTLYNELYSKEP